MLRCILILVLVVLGPSGAKAWTHGAVCSQGTTALAALSGLNSAQQAAYVTMICGMVVDGDFAHLTGLWTSTVSQANSLVNLANPGTHNLVNHSSTFGNPGWIGDGAAAYLDTGLGSGGTTNSASIGVCVLNSRTTSITGYAFAAVDGSAYQMLRVLDNAGSQQSQVELNGATPLHTVVSANAQGAYGLVRSNSSQINLYFNGSLTGSSPIADSSVSNNTFAMSILAYNFVGTIQNFSTDTVGYAWMGDGSVNATNLYNRLHTFINNASIGGSAC